MAIDVSSYFPNIGSLSNFIPMLVWGIIFGGVLIVAVIFIRNKLKYVYYGIIFKRRQSLEEGIPESKVLKGKAGYFNKKGKSVFRIKYGIKPWDMVELNKLPDPNYMLDNLAVYEQLNKDNLVQCKMDIDWDGGLKIVPVEEDLKYGALIDIYEKDKVLDTKKISTTTVGMIIIGMILVAGIIVYYFLSKA